MTTELDALYQEIILDHYKNPHHKGLRDPFEAEVHHVNPTCGDEVTLRVHVAEGPNGVQVEDVSYDALGCSISQASASVLTDLVIGKPVDEAKRKMAAGEGTLEASMVKAYVCRAAEWVTRESMQLHGGMDYAEEFPVSRFFVDARVLSIFEGADETLCLRVIARRLAEQALTI